MSCRRQAPAGRHAIPRFTGGPEYEAACTRWCRASAPPRVRRPPSRETTMTPGGVENLVYAAVLFALIGLGLFAFVRWATKDTHR
jgi:hypothetical protein